MSWLSIFFWIALNVFELAGVGPNPKNTIQEDSKWCLVLFLTIAFVSLFCPRKNLQQSGVWGWDFQFKIYSYLGKWGWGVKMAKRCAYDVIHGWTHVAIALLGYRNPPSLSDKRSENINQFTNMTRSLLLASQHQKLSKHDCAISSHINNQSWIYQFVLIIFCFIFKGLRIS